MFAILQILIGHLYESGLKTNRQNHKKYNEIRGILGAQFKWEGAMEEIKVDPPNEEDDRNSLSLPLFIRQLCCK